LVDQFADEGISLTHLDLGGGFGISYEETEQLDLENYLKGVLELASNYPNLTLMLEPGRAIVANAGILITRVEYLKETEDKRFALVDAGMNDLLRPSLYQAWHDIIAVKQTKNARDRLVDVVGPVCETGCFLGHARHLSVESGDLLSVKHAGAYGFTMSSNYNTRAKPAEILIDEDASYIIRERETFDDMVRGERLLKRT
jgi:diaminopimelate decarboxylase